jgi:hypothetical protein
VRQDENNDESYTYEDDCSDGAGMDCDRCGIRIDNRKLMGVNCELCEMYFHKSCAGQCCCEPPDADAPDEGGIHLDLTMLDEDTDIEQGQ